MVSTKTLVAPLALVFSSGAVAAQEVGSRLGEVELEDFAQTRAASFDDFLGRTVLIEFFAHW
jgi:hypothetical protein